ncbi:MAG: cusA [Massilia sp.]|nr:cusA [Massilia sp.]
MVDVGNGINPAGDAPDVHVDAAKAALGGMDPDAITKSLDAVLRGTVVTRIASGIKMVGVRLWVPEGIRNTDTDLRNLQIRAPDGHLFPLQRVATLRAISGQRSAVSRRLPAKPEAHGRSHGAHPRPRSRIGDADVKQVLAQPGLLPAGSYFVLWACMNSSRSPSAGS